MGHGAGNQCLTDPSGASHQGCLLARKRGRRVVVQGAEETSKGPETRKETAGITDKEVTVSGETQRDRQADGGTDTHVHTRGGWGEGAESRALYKSLGSRLTSPLYHLTV